MGGNFVDVWYGVLGKLFCDTRLLNLRVAGFVSVDLPMIRTKSTDSNIVNISYSTAQHPLPIK